MGLPKHGIARDRAVPPSADAAATPASLNANSMRSSISTGLTRASHPSHTFQREARQICNARCFGNHGVVVRICCLRHAPQCLFNVTWSPKGNGSTSDSLRETWCWLDRPQSALLPASPLATCDLVSQLLVLLGHGGPLSDRVVLADAQHLPQGRHQAGDRHLKIHESWDNLLAPRHPLEANVRRNAALSTHLMVRALRRTTHYRAPEIWRHRVPESASLYRIHRHRSPSRG